MEIRDFDPDRSWIIPLEESFNAIWYMGTENSIRRGLDLLFDNLNKHGHILIGEPLIFDYIDFEHEEYEDVMVYVILYKSLPKLEYLEYKWQEKMSKGV